MSDTKQTNGKQDGSERRPPGFEVLLSLIGAAVGILANVLAGVVSLQTLPNIPSEYLFAILTALALVMVGTLIVFFSKWQERRTQWIVKRLRFEEQRLFKDVDDMSTQLLKAEVPQ